ncbi:envelope fusion protein [Wolbachia endosymbiont of Psylliodes chrysocephala]|uniref:envelope fusion protein n=1 Tax=Wolbachia endosymbiont of Psylliodes chrysocephala TaxID=2883236 RepID=UPI00209E8FFC|nr:envelope fusion protein [Wolbachia endosymbiont of Psylliodes chrysocephala]
MKSLINEQITLVENSLDIFNKSSQVLAHNQLKLKSQINKIEHILETAQIQNKQTFESVYIQEVTNQISILYQNIYDLLEKIETAITFSKINVFHNSIIDPKDLINHIKLINNNLLNNKLPFEPILNNILKFEKIMQIKSYSKNNKIIFIIEIPIVERENYDLYQLFPLPTPKSNLFQMIIPNSKFLILNEQNFMSFDSECQEISNQEFICHESVPTPVEEDAPCEVSLLRFSKNLTNCQTIPLDIVDLKIQKIRENKWMIISPQNTVAQRICGQDSDNVPLEGTFLLELINKCSVRIGKIVLRSNELPKSEFKIIELPKVNIKNSDDKNPIYLKPIKLNSIDLEQLTTLKDSLNFQKQKVKRIFDNPIHFNNISVWTILIYIFIAFCLLFCIYSYRKYRKNSSKKSSKEENPEASPRILL